MDHLVFESYGCVVLKRGERHFVRYESGEAVGSVTMECPITNGQLEKLRRSEKDAYEVILENQFLSYVV
ncbi:MAG: hypothetical protein AB7I35_15275 [Ramlibacter sp.]